VPVLPGEVIPTSRQAPGQPSLRGAAAGLNVVRPRAARCGRSALTPAAAPALTGTCPETPGTRPPRRPVRCKTSRACQGSSEADPSRIK